MHSVNQIPKNYLMRFFNIKRGNTSRKALRQMIDLQRKELDTGFRKLSIALADYNLSSLATTAEALRRNASQMQHFDLADALRHLERLAVSNAKPNELYEAMDPIIEQMPLTRKVA